MICLFLSCHFDLNPKNHLFVPSCTSIHSTIALFAQSISGPEQPQTPKCKSTVVTCVCGRVAGSEHLHLSRSHFCSLHLHYEAQESKEFRLYGNSKSLNQQKPRPTSHYVA